MEQVKIEIDSALSWRKDDRHLTVREVMRGSMSKYTESYTKNVSASGEYDILIYGVISDLQSLSYFVSLYTDIERRSALAAFYNIKYSGLIGEIVEGGDIGADKFSGLISAMPPFRK